MKTIVEKSQEYAETAFAKALKAPWPEAKQAFADAYLAGATEVLARQWKDPKVELPEMLTRVLVCIKEPYGFPHVHICKRIYHDRTNPENDKWHWTHVVRDSDVVAWMPIPEPPKDENV